MKLKYFKWKWLKGMTSTGMYFCRRIWYRIRGAFPSAAPSPKWILWARIRELVSKESSEVTQEPRILRTRATSALQVDQRSDRPGQRSALLSFSHSLFLLCSSSRLIPRCRRRRRLRTMAQSRCPLAKLKYLAFERALKVHARGEPEDLSRPRALKDCMILGF